MIALSWLQVLYMATVMHVETLLWISIPKTTSSDIHIEVMLIVLCGQCGGELVGILPYNGIVWHSFIIASADYGYRGEWNIHSIEILHARLSYTMFNCVYTLLNVPVLHQSLLCCVVLLDDLKQQHLNTLYMSEVSNFFCFRLISWTSWKYHSRCRRC